MHVIADAFDVRAEGRELRLVATSLDDGSTPGRLIISHDRGSNDREYERTAVIRFAAQGLAKILDAALAAGLITVSACLPTRP